MDISGFSGSIPSSYSSVCNFGGVVDFCFLGTEVWKYNPLILNECLTETDDLLTVYLSPNIIPMLYFLRLILTPT